MHHGFLLPGHDHFDEEGWRNDALVECHFDDKLWGWSCRIAEELRVRKPFAFEDPIIYNLLRIGTFDWTDENKRGDQSRQAMRYSAVGLSRLHRAISDMKAEVSPRDLLTSCH